MKWTNEIVLSILFVSVIDCYNIKIFDSLPSNDLPTFHKHTLLEMCFPNQLNPVIITADLIDIMHESQRNEAVDSSLVVIDKNFKSKLIQKYYSRHPTYVLSTDSIVQLEVYVNEIKSSYIWNIASMIVTVGKDYDRAWKVLQMIWEIEALSSYYVCQHRLSNRTIIYTFNPYTDRAPEPWRKEKIADKPDDRWTLYRQQFVHSESMCSNLTFDKTKYLDGYPFKVFAFGKEDRVVTGKASFELFKKSLGVAKTEFENLITPLNITPVLYLNPEYIKFDVVFNRLENKTYDMFLSYVSSKYNRSRLRRTLFIFATPGCAISRFLKFVKLSTTGWANNKIISSGRGLSETCCSVSHSSTQVHSSVFMSNRGTEFLEPLQK